MDRRQSLLLTLTMILALVAGISVPSLQEKKPSADCSPSTKMPNSPQVSPALKQVSLDQLAQTALENQCSNQQTPLYVQDSSRYQRLLQQYRVLSEHLQAIENKIEQKVKIHAHWDRALKLAGQATELGKKSSTNPDHLHKAKSLWEDAINSLGQIPADSESGDSQTKTLHKRATQKIQEYKGHLANITYRLEVSQSEFLAPIAKRSGLSSQVKITICHLYSRRCRRLRGNEPPRDAASLMKLPVAVALMEKLTTEKIRFDTPIYLDPGNFTEDHSTLSVGQKYPIERLLKEMIANSSNTATNQLIDYLGWDYINKVLQERGFEITRINFKVMGDQIMPRNPGSGRNRLTSDELTEMMIQIYNREHLGDETLILALEGQYDHALGFDGLKGAAGNWLGEKTGQTSRVLGTTLAMNLFGETYIITVIDDGNYSEPSIRNFVSEIAEFIFRNGHL